jgi:hypothetical protein
MRHIIHQILARYLNTERAAFDASLRELWPTDRYAFRPPSAGNGAAPVEEPARSRAAYGELEHRN